MDENTYACFLEKLGHKVRQVDGVHWFNVNKITYMPVNPSLLLSPQLLDYRSILGMDGMIARFVSANGIGRSSYQFLCNPVDYDINYIKSSDRRNIRKSQQSFQFRIFKPINHLDEMKSIHTDTLTRQGRKVNDEDLHALESYIRLVNFESGFEVWGAFRGEQLAAYLISVQVDSTSHILILRSSQELLGLKPNNGLVFEFASHKLNQIGCDSISFGYEPIQGSLPGLVRFKKAVGFEKVHIGQYIYIKPWLRPLALSLPLNLIGKLGNHSGDMNISKLVGCLQWHNQQVPLTTTRTEK